MPRKMTTADLKGDTARGAKAISEAQARQLDQTSAPKPKAKSKPASDAIPEWKEYSELRELNFNALVERRTMLKAEIDFREAKLDELDIEIQAALAVAGAEKVIWEDRPVQIVYSKGGDKISAQKLIAEGVGTDVIARCTEPGKPFSYLLVGKPPKQ